MSGHWEDIDPTKYDGAREIPGLVLGPGCFISPYDVPDGVRIQFSARRGYEITLRYLTDQEKIVPTASEVPWVRLGLGLHSKRLVTLAVADATDFPDWEAVEPVLMALTSRRKRVNYFVALSVLRDEWSRLARRAREVRAG